MAIKRLSRNVQLDIKRLNFGEWSKEHSEFSRGWGMITVMAPSKEKIAAMKNLLEKLEETSEVWRKSQDEPQFFKEDWPLWCWRTILDLDRALIGVALYQSCLYEMTEFYTEDEFRLLVLQYSDKERKKFEQLRSKFDNSFARSLKDPRIRIPEEVRIAVWRRDKSACVRCGSREKLEYDHIIPLSKGGSNTIRNIELLCEKCNRSKSNKIQ